MSTAFTDISAALDGHLKAFSDTNNVNVAWENKKYKLVTGESYIRATLLPGNTDPTGYADASDEHVGVYQLDVIAPIDKGKSAYMPMADKIATHFKRGSLISYGDATVNVQSTSIGKASKSGASMIINIDIRYKSFTPPR